MSGRRIEDKGGWPASSEEAMMSKTHCKTYKSAEGAGHLGSMYPDTTEEIERDQKKGSSKVHEHPMKPGFRY
jgi:hypothetical protein